MGKITQSNSQATRFLDIFLQFVSSKTANKVRKHVSLVQNLQNSQKILPKINMRVYTIIQGQRVLGLRKSRKSRARLNLSARMNLARF